MGFPGGSDGKESACNAGDLGSIPGSGRFPGEGNGNPLQYSCLENSMDRGIWGVYSPWVTMSRTELSNQHFTLLVLKHHLFKFPPKNTQYFTLKKKFKFMLITLIFYIPRISNIFTVILISSI